MISLQNRRGRLSLNRGHLDWKPDKIRVFQSFLYLCDVNMMLKIELEKHKRTFVLKNIENRAVIEYNWYTLMDMG